MLLSGKKNILLYILVSILIISKLYYWFFVFPNPDEAYYWHWGQFPALSYHDHPTLQATVQGIFHWLFGKSLFVLRLPAFICSLICGYIIYLFSKKLEFKHSEFHIVLFFACPLFFLFTSFAWNDYMLVTNCFLAGYFAIAFLHDKWIGNRGKTRDIFLTALFFGLAIISKYNAIFFGVGLLTMVFFNKKLHIIFKDYRFYVAMILTVIVSSPIAIWNLQNKFGSFEFNIQQRTLNPLLKLEFFEGNYTGFLIGSLVMISPFLWWGIVKTWKQTISNENSYKFVYQKFAKHIFLASSISFLFLSLFSNVLYYWNIVAYLFIIPLASEVIIQRKKVIATLIFSTLVCAAAVFHFGVVPFTSVFGGDDQDSTYHYGWTAVKNKVQELQQQNSDAVLLTSSYRKASLLAFALNNREVYSYSSRFDQFDYWTKNLTFKNNQNAIIVTDDRKPLNKELTDILRTFSSPDTLKIKKFGYPVKEYYIYTGKLK